MELENIECQLAQVQMRKYLEGEPLPKDAVIELEKHISKCHACKMAAEEKRISLTQMLGETEDAAPSRFESTEAPETTSKEAKPKKESKPKNPKTKKAKSEAIDVDESAPEPIAAQLTQKEPEQPEEMVPPVELVEEPSDPSVREALEMEPEPVNMEASPAIELPPTGEETPKESAPAALTAVAASQAFLQKNWKTLAYSLALGLVLIGMSAFSRNPSGVLGAKVIAADKKEETKDKSEETLPVESKHGEIEHKEQPEKRESTKEQIKEPINEPTAEEHDQPATEVVEPEPVIEDAEPPVQEYQVAKSSGIARKSVKDGQLVKPSPQKKSVEKATEEVEPKQGLRGAYQKRTKTQVVKKRAYRPRKRIGSIRVYDVNGVPVNPAGE